MVCIVVRINGLRLKARYGVKLFDSCRTKARQGSENSTLNLCNLSVLHSIHEGVLSFCCMVLQLFGSVLLAERRDLVEIHLQVMGHLLCKFVLWVPCWCRVSVCTQLHHRRCSRNGCSRRRRAALSHGDIRLGTLEKLTKECIFGFCLTLENCSTAHLCYLLLEDLRLRHFSLQSLCVDGRSFSLLRGASQDSEEEQADDTAGHSHCPGS